MRSRGVERVDCFSVDNALIRPASPVFVGACAEHDCDCGEARPAWPLSSACMNAARKQACQMQLKKPVGLPEHGS